MHTRGREEGDEGCMSRAGGVRFYPMVVLCPLCEVAVWVVVNSSFEPGLGRCIHCQLMLLPVAHRQPVSIYSIYVEYILNIFSVNTSTGQSP